jgi:hypothetical protein
LTCSTSAMPLISCWSVPRGSGARQPTTRQSHASSPWTSAGSLALEHAGAYIVRNRASFRRYRELWQSSRDKVISWSDPAVTHYPRAIAATWQTSVDQLGGAARHLLERLAFLAPDPVPMFLLDVAIPEDEGEDLNEALADLAAYSLATRDPEEPRFLVHGLVQDVTRRSLDATQSQQRVIEALGWLNAAFDGEPYDVRTWPRLDPLAPHAQSVTRRADAAGIAQPTGRLMNQLGMLLHAKSLNAQAESLFRRAQALGEASFGLDQPEVATDPFSSRDQLRGEVLKEPWPDQPRTGQPVTKPKYDVFLSHSHADAPWVEDLAKRLQGELGFAVWLDRWELVPGRSWQQEIAQGLEQARCCAVCINNATPRGWFRQELERALSLQVHNDKFGVIPILLPDASPDFVPDFLSLRTWVDFRTGKDQNYAYHVLSQGIRGKPVGPWPPMSPAGNDVSLPLRERQILQLQRFRTLGVHEEVVIEFERKILTEWFQGGD